tara:strand:+ start:2998 stop:3300 length:303 start_codon:yes stop_codon:yes gene_type:complete
MNVDHIALVVESPEGAAAWYQEQFGCEILYADATWSFVQFDNIKIAFVVKEQHPRHVAFRVDEFTLGDKTKMHRDGTESVYKTDPWGNILEMIKYPGKEI